MDTCGRRTSPRRDARALAIVAMIVGACEDASTDDVDRSALPELAYCDPVRAWGQAERRAESALLRAIDDARTSWADCGALGRFPAADAPLRPTGALQCAARRHAQFLVGAEALSHADADAALVDARVDAAGYDAVIVSELLAAGTVEAARIVDPLWQRSPAHCADLHAPDWRDVGVAALGDPASRWGAVWVVVFGVPQPEAGDADTNATAP